MGLGFGVWDLVWVGVVKCYTVRVGFGFCRLKLPAQRPQQEVVLLAVARDGRSLQHASERLRDDQEARRESVNAWKLHDPDKPSPYICPMQLRISTISFTLLFL